MGFGINSNIDALRAYNALATVNASTTKAQLRLATGKRINSVADPVMPLENLLTKKLS